MHRDLERAILAGGCFWGMQEALRKTMGVLGTRVGYTGGMTLNPTHADVMTGQTGHVEALELVFDRNMLTFRSLLSLFFQIHDPTTVDQQGRDHGTQYRSMIFNTTDEQLWIARDFIADMEESGLWPGKVVTEIRPVGIFWDAGPEHQDYLQRVPDGYTCHFPRPNWKLPERVKKELMN